MRDSEVRPGLKVVIGKLNSPSEIASMISGRNHFMGYVPGHGGAVWFVLHDDGTIGAYSFTEMEPQATRDELPVELL